MVLFHLLIDLILIPDLLQRLKGLGEIVVLLAPDGHDQGIDQGQRGHQGVHEGGHVALGQQLKEGKKGLILMEHYSNFDLPILIYMLSSTCGETGRELSERIVAIAGMKLNEDNPYIAAFAEAYARIVIYPSRSLAAVNDPEEHKKEEQRSRLINIASMRAFERVRQEGNAVLVFPSGTRYRPGHPETKRGVREIDSYIKLSDVVMPVSINGNCLRIPESKHEMTEDVVFHDRLIMTAGNICSAAALREEAKQWAAQAEPDQTDRKQITVDYVMHILENMHTENEKGRLDGLEETPGSRPIFPASALMVSCGASSTMLIIERFSFL